MLRYDHRGREPTEAEWAAVESHTQKLFGVLTPTLRRKFLMGSTPKWVTLVAIGFALLAVLALFVALLLIGIGERKSFVLPLYLVWLISLGAIGSIAFIGMNALSIQDDATFDLTNQRLMCLRISLGALFGLVLALPFGFTHFVKFCEQLTGDAPFADAGSWSTQAVMLLLPFVLGFSTTVVIMILNQFVEAVQTFFGKKSTAPPAISPPGIETATAVTSTGRQ